MNLLLAIIIFQILWNVVSLQKTSKIIYENPIHIALQQNDKINKIEDIPGLNGAILKRDEKGKKILKVLEFFCACGRKLKGVKNVQEIPSYNF